MDALLRQRQDEFDTTHAHREAESRPLAGQFATSQGFRETEAGRMADQFAASHGENLRRAQAHEALAGTRENRLHDEFGFRKGVYGDSIERQKVLDSRTEEQTAYDREMRERTWLRQAAQDAMGESRYKDETTYARSRDQAADTRAEAQADQQLLLKLGQAVAQAVDPSQLAHLRELFLALTSGRPEVQQRALALIDSRRAALAPPAPPPLASVLPPELMASLQAEIGMRLPDIGGLNPGKIAEQYPQFLDMLRARAALQAAADRRNRPRTYEGLPWPDAEGLVMQ